MLLFTTLHPSGASRAHFVRSTMYKFDYGNQRFPISLNSPATRAGLALWVEFCFTDLVNLLSTDFYVRARQVCAKQIDKVVNSNIKIKLT